MSDNLAGEIRRVEAESGPQPDMTAFLTVRQAVRETVGSDAARAYQDGALVTLHSDEGREYTIRFDSLVEELLLVAATDTGLRLTEPG